VSLEAELLSVEGVAGAKVDLDTSGPVGLKITVLPGADSELIAQHVSAVLASRGLSSTLGSQQQADAPSPIIAGDESPDERGDEEPAPHLSIPHLPETRTKDPREGPRNREMVPEKHAADPEPPIRAAADRGTGVPDPVLTAPRVRVATAAISESAKGVELALRMSDGRRVTRRTQAEPRSVAQGVVNALASLLDQSEDPVLLLDLDRKSVEGTVVVTVVVRANGEVGVGSAKEFATEILAVARATWRALGDLAV